MTGADVPDKYQAQRSLTVCASYKFDTFTEKVLGEVDHTLDEPDYLGSNW